MCSEPFPRDVIGWSAVCDCVISWLILTYLLTSRIQLINLENGSFRNRENLQYKKTADSVLLSLFMRTNRLRAKKGPAPP